ncbi:hypothetical protein [Priestia taiwanensis]|uniref:Rho termination factor N-terminal domain-containing protein n=1 Tax=Priestia taiwanensis TaxID=1347902 RepID=A0A917AMG7_9BACI|nr:hypothetical protein [Priestia taiwanensis]MBM7361983.1 hypothetical protein [Priestia taiwanensis]GGE58513.1 hypothetical protein GCM10007140_06080 [Priestia taiwanensis]
MKVEMRKTASGTEYWDTKEKRTLFVATGDEEDFEVTVNLKNMLEDEGSADTSTDIDLDAMNAEQLLAFAKQNNIDVPGNMKKEETIRNHIAKHYHEVL